MNEEPNTNYAELSGLVDAEPQFSHETRGERFYSFPVRIRRLSGTADVIQVLVRQTTILTEDLHTGQPVHVFGQLRSYNNKSGVGPKLMLHVFAKELNTQPMEDRNDILLHGTICKQPNFRTTPMGREICDFMLAVNRKYGRSDYLPCIAWGQKARLLACLDVGTVLSLRGRIQSRQYIKVINDLPVEKTAYEVSLIDFEEAE